VETLRNAVIAIAERWNAGDIRDDKDSLAIRFTPAHGVRTFVTVQSQPDALFAPLYKIEVSTLVGNADFRVEVIEFLDASNSETVGGAWERFEGGDIGVTGQLVVSDPEQPGLFELIHQLILLQVEDALATGRPRNAVPFEDLDVPRALPFQLVAHGEVSLEAIAEVLHWRSGHVDAWRWILDDLQSDQCTFLAPFLVADPVRLETGEPRDDLRSVTIARTSHPRHGAGVLIQVALAERLREDALRYRHLGILTQAGRWFGTGLGGLMIWGEGDSIELVYRAFLPLDLLAVVDGDAGVDLIVDAALGAVNIAGIAEAIIEECAATGPEDGDRLNLAIDQALDALRPLHRLAALRASTHVRERADGLADVDGPLVDVGEAVLDRLAIDLLQIHTSPSAIFDRCFAWLPGPHVQRVAATPMRPSRLVEVTEVSVVTELGVVAPPDLDRARKVCSDMTSSMPLCSLLISMDGEVVVDTKVMVHEGVWWHRAVLVSVVAALQLNCASQMQGVFELSDIRLDLESELRNLLEGDDLDNGFDSIFDVIPSLREHARMEITPLEDLIALVDSRLLELPGSRPFGSLDEEPDPVVVLAGLHPGGGWDPELGEVLVRLRAVDHEVVGPAVEIEVNPGFVPSNPDLAGEARRLTAATHQAGGLAICPSWQVSGSTICTTLVIPKIAIAATWLDGGAAIIHQAVISCVHAIAKAVIASADLFPGFDRSQINLIGAAGEPHDDGANEPRTITWAPVVTRRVLAFPEAPGRVEHWYTVALTMDATLALGEWLTNPVGDGHFEHPGTLLRAARSNSGVTIEAGQRRFALNGPETHSVCLQLRHPEGPATGRARGRVVLEPIGDMVDADGDTCILVAPCVAAAAVMSAPEPVCAGVSAVTSSSFWLRFHSEESHFDVDIGTSLGEQMLEGADREGDITFVLAFPQVDSRVVQPPPPAQTFTLRAADVRSAFAEILGVRDGI